MPDVRLPPKLANVEEVHGDVLLGDAADVPLSQKGLRSAHVGAGHVRGLHSMDRRLDRLGPARGLEGRGGLGELLLLHEAQRAHLLDDLQAHVPRPYVRGAQRRGLRGGREGRRGAREGRRSRGAHVGRAARRHALVVVVGAREGAPDRLGAAHHLEARQHGGGAREEGGAEGELAHGQRLGVAHALRPKDEATSGVAVQRGRGLDGEVGASLLRSDVDRGEVLSEHAVGREAVGLEHLLIELRVRGERARLVPVQVLPRVAERVVAANETLLFRGALDVPLLTAPEPRHALVRIELRQRHLRGEDVHDFVPREVVRNVHVLHGGGFRAQNHRLASEVLVHVLDLVVPRGVHLDLVLWPHVAQALEGRVLQVVLGLPLAPSRHGQVEERLEGAERRGGAAGLEDESGVRHEQRGLGEQVGGHPSGHSLVLLLARSDSRCALALRQDLALRVLEHLGPLLAGDEAQGLACEPPRAEAQREGLLRPLEEVRLDQVGRRHRRTKQPQGL
mmetsp:Transcript_8014/g.23775  ORF Transcript_8014/g.23775 Transcript_8014/m.23775 type:complete len:506 (+) Transcript_8014:1320-2837(+)